MVTLPFLQPRRCAGLSAMALCLTLGAAASASAEHKARIDLALADHLAAGSQSIDVILHGDKATVDSLATRYNARVKKYLRSGAVLKVTAGQAAALQNDDDVDHLSVDVKYRSLGVDPIDEGIGADQVWAGAGDLRPLSGRGVTVAVIDSGMDLKHAAFRGRVLRTVDFTGGDGIDLFGHGTHVAAIIAGQQGRVPDTADYRGVAFGAYLLNLRVLDKDGAGSASDVIEAIDWSIEHKREYNIGVINLSVGGPVLQSYRDDPVCEAVERAVNAGIVVVAAAGNFGETADGHKLAGGITSPGNSPYAITVGALDTKGTAERSDDVVASFSSNGPTRFDLVVKPDLVAPGRRVTSAEAAGSYLSVNFTDQHVAGTGVNAYIRGSGTSMAAAFVSGAAALLAEERPSLTPMTMRVALQATSSLMPEGLLRSGAGSLNVLAAAEFVMNGVFQSTRIGNETAQPGTLVFTSSEMPNLNALFQGANVDSQRTLRPNQRVFASARGFGRSTGSRTYGNSDSLVWGETDSLVWGETDSLVWGEAGSLVWGETGSLVWGETGSLVWGETDSLVWGETDSLVWGESDSLVWGETDSLVWGEADSLVWGEAIWSASAASVWAN